MKINLEDLKKAVKWIEENTLETNVSIYTGENGKLRISCIDRYGSEIEITMFEDASMLAKIKKTELL